jgi:lysozyme family protein
MTALDQAWVLVLQSEGGYSNDPADPGGETKYGISKRAYPTEDVKSLTVERAKEIFRRDFWDAMHCGEMPAALALAVADAAFNHGPRTATEMLQDALGVKRDGILGPTTLRHASHAGPDVVIRFCRLRVTRYHDLAALRPYQRKFLAGWVERVLRVHRAAVSLEVKA